MLKIITDINDILNGIVWGWPALILLAFVGVFMTCRTKFFQLTHIGHWMKQTIGAIFRQKDVRSHTKDKSISQFQSLCTALAATVGTGNIVGVAGAIMVGGPGAAFWMGLIAFFGLLTNYAENVLGIFYRRKNSAGAWFGGGLFYLRGGQWAREGGANLGPAAMALGSQGVQKKPRRTRAARSPVSASPAAKKPFPLFMPRLPAGAWGRSAG